MENQSELKWYQKQSGIIILLIIFFPVGLYQMWKNDLWSKGIRWGVTALFITLAIVANSGESITPNNSINTESINDTVAAQPPAFGLPTETPVESNVLTQEEIENNRIKEEEEEKKRKYEEGKERVTDCLVGSFEASWGTYSFYSNGDFSWEVSSGPYQQYREGTWKYIGGNKVKLNKKWLQRSGTITISKYCEISGLDF